MIRRSVAVRFVEKIRVDVKTGCWVWTAGARKARIYGGFWHDGRMRSAHRVAYELFVGPIPEALTIDHLCRNTLCVNPEHLEAVTKRENTLRGESFSAVLARKTHCAYGHPLSGDNLYLDPAGGRECRTCRRRRDRTRYLRLTGQFAA